MVDHVVSFWRNYDWRVLGFYFWGRVRVVGRVIGGMGLGN